MEIRKSKKADLEKFIGLFFETGLVIGLSLTLLAFEWTTKPSSDDHIFITEGTSYMVEEMRPTIREEQKTKPVKLQKIVEIIQLVDDDVSIDHDNIFDLEIDEKTEVDISDLINEDKEVFPVEETFIDVSDMPLFNGGDPRIEFRRYITENLEYPSIAAENGISGRVIVQFVVDSKGRVVDAVILGSVDPALDKEALRVILSSPLWTPGKQRGRPVRVLYVFPINFVLQNH